MIKIHRRLLLLATTALLPLGPAFAQNLPTGGQFVGGTSGTISSSGNTMTVQTNSNRSITNWTTFNIGSGYQVNINQPNSGSVALERVTGGLGPSSIFGTLTSNGIVFLLNPNGILFGRGAVVNVGGFLASTNRISNSDFLAGHYRFHGGNPSVSIVNYGSITAATGGFAALVAPGVRNSGTITATLGTVGLAAGRGFTLDLYGDKLINLAVNDKLAKQVIDVATGQPLSSLITNTGKISANGGRVEITAAAARNIVSSVINTSGVIEANSIGQHDGMIVLNGGRGNVQVAGTLSASGKRKGTKGGTIEIAGENISVTGAKINASGKDGGGTVLIGGDVGGGKGNAAFANIPQAALQPWTVPNAQTVSIDAATTINASALVSGNGGKVVVWSDQLTTFAGLIKATGGAQGGNGGFVETSGGMLQFAGGRVDTSAPLGKTGFWLLDPANLTIDSSGAAAISNALTSNNVLVLTTAEGATSSYGTTTGGAGDIVVAAPISWTTANSLTLTAYHDINVNASISLSNGTLNLTAQNAVAINSTVGISGAGAVNLSTATDPTYGVAQLSFGNSGSVQFTGTPNSGQALSINGQPYSLLYSMSDLQNINSGNLSGNYALAKPLDATGVANWTPIGTDGSGNVINEGSGFSGAFQGLGNTISNLTINMPSVSNVGLFGSVGSGGTVQNVGLLGGSVAGQWWVGALVGSNAGNVSQSYSTAAVSGLFGVGGLVGHNAGAVVSSYATGQVHGTGGDDVGGLVGNNWGGTVTQSYATGAVNGPLDVGGLVGDNSGGSISHSYSSGPVTGTNSTFNYGIGGLVGYMYGGTISQSYSTSSVTGGSYAGGLVGWSTGTVFASYATGAVSGSTNVGGLIGYNAGTVSQSYASGAVSGATAATTGALVGVNDFGGNVASTAFWDMTTGLSSGVGTNNGTFSGQPLTTSQFSTASNFSGFTFGNTPGGNSCGDGGACWVIVNADGSIYNPYGYNNSPGATRPMLLSEWSTTITNPHQLQLMALDPTANYTLANGIKLGLALSNPSDVWGPSIPSTDGVPNPNAVASFLSIGTNGNWFTGTFNGGGYTISGLNLAPTDPNLSTIGLFGSIGVGGLVEDLRLTGATVTANQSLSANIPGQFVGVLAGQNAGLIENVSVSGTVNGGTSTGVNAGGLVGQNGIFGPGDFQAAGTIRNARANVAVTLGDGCSGDCNGGFNSAGGLVGFNPGVIAHSEARGAIQVGSNAAAGGLVGTNGNYQQTEDGGSGGPIAGAKIYDSRASGTVSSAGVNVSLGGLVGQNNALSFIGRSRASGAVTSTATIDPNQNCNDSGYCQNVSAGGLVGQNAGIIVRSAARGDVSVENFAQAGGLVGINQGYRGEEGWYATAKIIDSFASGAVSSSGVNITIGGLVGLNGPGATITRSKAFGDVTSKANISPDTNQNCDSGNCQYVNAGGLAGQNAGVIVRSSAHGDVSVGSFAQAGGLVGLNGGFFGDSPIRSAAIFDSSASGAVSSNGVSVTLGGLVGENQAGSLIKNSRATGDVTSTSSSQGDCAGNANCLISVVGGLVGQNSGVIAGRWFEGTPTKCRSGDTCASGTVSVGSEGVAGGLVGDNTGFIKNAFAIANVTGAAGLAGSSLHEFDHQTTVGGFVGANSGLILNSSAVGTVGSSTVNWLQAGGFVGDNSGVISRSFANVAVSAGGNSVAGGFAGSNAQNTDSSCCGGGYYNNKALITRSAAIGDVSVGTSSVAGGFAAYGDGTFYRVSASGAVSALGNSTVGGLVGALDVGGTISRSKAHNTLVTSTGPNSTVGGLVGANGGTISNSISTSPVTGGGDSFIGGLAGANFGSITNSKVDPVITGKGPNDVLGGIVGLNIGQLSGNTANVTLISNGSGNQVGGVAGVNGTYNFTGANPFTPGASTQTGDIGNSTSTGSSFSAIGSTVPPSAPAFPNWVPNCSATLCDGINNGYLQTVAGPPPPPPNPNDNGNTNGNYGSQQTASFTVPPIPNNNTSLNLNSPNFNQQSGGVGGNGGNPANGGTNGGGSNNGATGSLGSGTHGGNGAPPGTRLIDMPIIPLPPESGMPPPGETFFVSNEVNLHVGNGVSLQQIEQMAQQFGLTIVATNTIGLFGRTIYTLQISDGRTVQEVITAFQAANLPVWAGYVPKYGFAQEPAGRSADIDPVGDPAQYVIDKFHLNEIHRLARGDNVTIAVIDSEIDVRHPDLAGVVTDRYDAGCGATMPDAHGTGMTGAIASRRNLLGVAPKVKVIAICAFGGEATAESTSLKIIKGIDYAVSQGAKIINMSFAGPRDPALSQALQIAREKGVLLVAAAGNAGPKSPPLYPGADANVMAVTATDDHDRLFNRANQGKYISVAAPGVDILVPAPGGGVALTTGTSVATAHVTGVAALLLAQKSTRTPEELRAILVTTAKDLGPKGFDTQFGAGLVDPLRALQYGSAKSAAVRLPTLGR